MKLLLPNNIYAEIFSYLVPGISREDIVLASSAAISKELDENKADLALIPSLDLLNYPEFFVSGKTAISFDGSLSNSFFYFLKQIRMIKEVYLRGDVSKNDVILTKIMFTEQFDLNVEVFLDSHPFALNFKNYLVCGAENYSKDIFEAGLSLADQISDLLEAPYVNYVLVSKDEKILKDFTADLAGLDKMLEDNFEQVASKLSFRTNAVEDVKQNLNSVYYDMTETEKKSLTDLLRLPYFTGILEDIVETKFVD
jgi:hypothetical protein